MLTRAMIAARREQAYMRLTIWSNCAARASMYSLTALHLGARVGAGDRFECCVEAIGIVSGAAFTYTLTSNWSTPVAAWSA